MPVDEQDLFNGLKTGDRTSVESIYKQYLPSVKQMIRSNRGNDADAEDIFQETLETILLKIENIHSSLGGLIIQIAKRKWIDRIRKEKKTAVVRNEWYSRQDNKSGVEDDLIEKEKAYQRFKLLEETFLELSDLCRQLLDMIKAEKAVEEIVKELAFASANTVYRRKAACMERWSQLIKQQANF